MEQHAQVSGPGAARVRTQQAEQQASRHAVAGMNVQLGRPDAPTPTLRAQHENAQLPPPPPPPHRSDSSVHRQRAHEARSTTRAIQQRSGAAPATSRRHRRRKSPFGTPGTETGAILPMGTRCGLGTHHLWCCSLARRGARGARYAPTRTSGGLALPGRVARGAAGAHAAPLEALPRRPARAATECRSCAVCGF